MKMAVLWFVAPCSLVKFTDVSEVLAASIITLLTEAAGTSETSVNFYQTTPRYNPEDSRLLNTLKLGIFVFICTAGETIFQIR
jgi:hypothetical protein